MKYFLMIVIYFITVILSYYFTNKYLDKSNESKGFNYMIIIFTPILNIVILILKIMFETRFKRGKRNESVKNKFFLVSGHSGSGKSSIMKSLMKNEVISFTTRPKRVNEIHGKDYYFITKDEFMRMYDNNELAEYTEYGGNYYGLTKNEIDSKLANDHAFAIVDYAGVKQLKEYYDNCVTIILHTTREQAIKQMSERGDNKSDIAKRLETYNEEVNNKNVYDYSVINRYGKFHDTRFIIQSIIVAEIN